MHQLEAAAGQAEVASDDRSEVRRKGHERRQRPGRRAAEPEDSDGGELRRPLDDRIDEVGRADEDRGDLGGAPDSAGDSEDGGGDAGGDVGGGGALDPAADDAAEIGVPPLPGVVLPLHHRTTPPQLPLHLFALLVSGIFCQRHDPAPEQRDDLRAVGGARGGSEDEGGIGVRPADVDAHNERPEAHRYCTFGPSTCQFLAAVFSAQTVLNGSIMVRNP